MDYTIAFIVLVFAIGFVGSFISGMVGIGGAVINYPMLLFIPSLFGFAAFSAHEVAGISAVQVLVATLSSVYVYRNSGFLNKRLIVYMGSAILVGSLIGGFGSGDLSEQTVNLIYGIVALIAAILMFIPSKTNEDIQMKDLQYSIIWATLLAFIVGVLSGVVGAGGAFLLVPIMIVFLKMPTRITIATSLAITFISSIGTTIAKVATDQVLPIPAIVLVVASLLAAPLGAKYGQKVNQKVLQWILAVLITATAIKIWWDLFVQWTT